MKDQIFSHFDAMTNAEAHIRRNVQSVVSSGNNLGVLSSGDKIAVAFVLDR